MSELSPTTEWRRELSEACLNSPVWDNRLDQARQIYIAFLSQCITELPGNNASIPVADLEATPCHMCASDLTRICAENGGSVCAVDVTFEGEYVFPTEAPADNVTAEEPVAEMANFKYRFYECVPAECDNEDDEAVFAAGWIDDLEVTFDVVETNPQFETFCPREDVDPVDFVPGSDDTILGCDLEFISGQCFQDRERARQDDDEYRAARANYYNNFCPCNGLPRDIGNTTEQEWGCLCHYDGRDFQEQCFGENGEDDRLFCALTMAFFRHDDNGGITHYNMTMFDCLPSSCDNPFDRYALEHFMYELNTGNNAFDQFAGSFESHCWTDTADVPAYFFTEECDVAEIEIRGESDTRDGPVIDTNTEDTYRNSADECMFNALRAEPRTTEVTNAICTENLEPYMQTCSLAGDARMCAQSINFEATIDPEFGSQEFHVLMYQCVPEICHSPTDVEVYEFRDRFAIGSLLGIEDPDVRIVWDCPPLEDSTGTSNQQPQVVDLSGSSDSNSGATDIGIGIGIAIVVIAIVAAAASLCIWHRRKQGHRRLGDDEEENAATGRGQTTANGDEFDDEVNDDVPL